MTHTVMIINLSPINVLIAWKYAEPAGASSKESNQHGHFLKLVFAVRIAFEHQLSCQVRP